MLLVFRIGSNYKVEVKTKALGKSLQDMTLAEMDVYWEEAKKQ